MGADTVADTDQGNAGADVLAWQARAPDLTNLTLSGSGFIGLVELGVDDDTLCLSGHRTHEYATAIKWGVVAAGAAGLGLGVVLLGVEPREQLGDALVYVAGLLGFMTVPPVIVTQLLKGAAARRAPVVTVRIPLSDIRLGTMRVGHNAGLPPEAQEMYRAFAGWLTRVAASDREVALLTAKLGSGESADTRLMFGSAGEAEAFVSACTSAGKRLDATTG